MRLVISTKHTLVLSAIFFIILILLPIVAAVAEKPSSGAVTFVIVKPEREAVAGVPLTITPSMPAHCHIAKHLEAGMMFEFKIE